MPGKVAGFAEPKALEEVSSRFAGGFATVAALKALGARARAPNMSAVVQLADTSLPKLYVFDNASTATGDDILYLTPSDSPTAGRWKLVQNKRVTKIVAGQNETTTPAITVTGIAVGDILESFMVFNQGSPGFTVRALTDFTITADTLTVGANAADNSTTKQYMITYIDLT